MLYSGQELLRRAFRRCAVIQVIYGNNAPLLTSSRSTSIESQTHGWVSPASGRSALRLLAGRGCHSTQDKSRREERCGTLEAGHASAPPGRPGTLDPTRLP